jgi:HTH domain
MSGLHRRRKRATTTGDYAAMLRRMVHAYGKRIGQDPEAGLTHLRELEAELAAAVNVGIFTANKVGGVSINQLADMLGVSKQAIHKRVEAGARASLDETPRKIASAPVAAPKALPRGQSGHDRPR